MRVKSQEIEVQKEDRETRGLYNILSIKTKKRHGLKHKTDPQEITYRQHCSHYREHLLQWKRHYLAQLRFSIRQRLNQQNSIQASQGDKP